MIRVRWLGKQSVKDIEARTDIAVARGEEQVFVFEPLPTFRFSHDHDMNFLRVQRKYFEEYRAEQGIDLTRTRDGGGLLYQGPGQLIVWPIIRIQRDFWPSHARSIFEETMVRFLRSYGVYAFRHEPTFISSGVWVDDHNELRKIGFFASRFSKINNGMTILSRGCAVNISPDLRPFELINPCNIPGAHVSSVARLTGSSPDIDEALGSELVVTFSQVVREWTDGKISIPHMMLV